MKTEKKKILTELDVYIFQGTKESQTTKKEQQYK